MEFAKINGIPYMLRANLGYSISEHISGYHVFKLKVVCFIECSYGCLYFMLLKKNAYNNSRPSLRYD